jgi:hypothetical protein
LGQDAPQILLAHALKKRAGAQLVGLDQVQGRVHGIQAQCGGGVTQQPPAKAAVLNVRGADGDDAPGLIGPRREHVRAQPGAGHRIAQSRQFGVTPALRGPVREDYIQFRA